MAGSTDIGHASVVLSANADPLAKGLDQAAARTKKFGAEVGKSLEGMAKAGMGGPAGELTTKLGAVGVAFTAAAMAYNFALEEHVLKPLQRANELAGKLNAKIQRGFEERQAKDLADVRAAPDPGDRLAGAAARLKKQELEVSGLGAILRSARAELADMEDHGLLGKVKAWLNPTYAATYAEAIATLKQNVEGAEAKLETARKTAKDLNDELARGGREAEAATAALRWQAKTAGMTDLQKQEFGFKLGGATEEQLQAFRAAAYEITKQDVQKQVDDLTRSLEVQAKTFGMTAEQVKLYELQLKGATDEQLQQGFQLAAENDRRKQEKELTDQVKATTEALEFQIQTFGMAAHEVEALRLEKAGAAAEEVANVRRLGAELADLEKQKALLAEKPGPQLGGAFARGSAEAYSVVARYNTGPMADAAAAAKQQLQKLEEVKALLREVVKGVANFPVIKMVDGWPRPER